MEAAAVVVNVEIATSVDGPDIGPASAMLVVAVVAMVDSLGTLYIKKEFFTTAGNDGVEECCWGLPLPPYVIPSRYWIKARVMSSTSVSAKSQQEYRMSGRIGTMDRDHITDASPPSAASQFLTDMMEQYLPHEPGSVMDNTQDDQEDVGLTGSGVVPITAQEFFKREVVLGLPKNGIMVDADLQRYVDYFSTEGKIPNKMIGNYDQAHLIAWGVTTEDLIDMATNFEDDAIFGAAANAAPQLPVILESILDSIENNTLGDALSTFSVGVGDTQMVSSQVLNWMSASFGDAHPASGELIQTQMIVTLQVDVRIPQYSSHFVARSS